MSTLSPGWIRPATPWTWSTDTEMATSPWGTVSAATLAMVSGDTNIPDDDDLARGQVGPRRLVANRQRGW